MELPDKKEQAEELDPNVMQYVEAVLDIYDEQVEKQKLNSNDETV